MLTYTPDFGLLEAWLLQVHAPTASILSEQIVDYLCFDWLLCTVEPIYNMGMGTLQGILMRPKLHTAVLTARPFCLLGWGLCSFLGMTHTMLKTLVSTHLKTQVAK